MQVAQVCAHEYVSAPSASKYNSDKQITDWACVGHPACDNGPPKGGYMLWILAVLMGGLGFGYVTLRRKRKADQKG